MPLKIVPMITTPADEETMRFALTEAVVKETGALPSANLLAFMMAQTAMETSQWKSIQNFNVGNITIGENADEFAWRPPWFEPPFKNAREEKLHEEMLQGRAPKAFIAYGNLQLGANGYVNRLFHRFPEIIVAAEKGDARKVGLAINQKYCPNCFHAEEIRNLRELADRFGAEQVRQPIRGGHFGMWVLGGVASLMLAKWGLKK